MNGAERPPLAPKPQLIAPPLTAAASSPAHSRTPFQLPPIPKPRKNPPPKPVPYRQHKDNKQKDVTTFKSGIPVTPRKPVPLPATLSAEQPGEKPARRYSGKGEPSPKFFRKEDKQEPVQYAIPEVPKRSIKSRKIDSRPRLNTPLVPPDPGAVAGPPSSDSTPSVNGHLSIGRRPSKEAPLKPVRTDLLSNHHDGKAEEGALYAEAYAPVVGKEEEDEEAEGYAIVKTERGRRVNPTAAPRSSISPSSVSSSPSSSSVVSPAPPITTPTPPPPLSPSGASSGSTPPPPPVKPRPPLPPPSSKPPLPPPPVDREADHTPSPPAVKPRSPPLPQTGGDSEYSVTSHKTKPAILPAVSADSEYSVTSHSSPALKPRSPLVNTAAAAVIEYSVTSHTQPAKPKLPLPHMTGGDIATYNVTSHKALSPPQSRAPISSPVRPPLPGGGTINEEYASLGQTEATSTASVTVVNGAVYAELSTTCEAMTSSSVTTSVFANPTVAESYGHLEVQSTAVGGSGLYEEIKPVPSPRGATSRPPLPLPLSEQPSPDSGKAKIVSKLKSSQLQSSRDRSILPAYQRTTDDVIENDVTSPSSPLSPSAHKPHPPPTAAKPKPPPPPKPQAPTPPIRRRRKNKHFAENERTAKAQAGGRKAVSLAAARNDNETSTSAEDNSAIAPGGPELTHSAMAKMTKTATINEDTLERANYETWRTFSPVLGEAKEKEEEEGELTTADKGNEIHDTHTEHMTDTLPMEVAMSPKFEVDIDFLIQQRKTKQANGKNDGKSSPNREAEDATTTATSGPPSVMDGLALPGQEWGPHCEDRHTSATTTSAQSSLGYENQQVMERLRQQAEDKEPSPGVDGDGSSCSLGELGASAVFTVHRAIKTDALGYSDVDIDSKLVVGGRDAEDSLKDLSVSNGAREVEMKGGDGSNSGLTESGFFTVKSNTRVDPMGYCDVELLPAPTSTTTTTTVTAAAAATQHQRFTVARSSHTYCDVDLEEDTTQDNNASSSGLTASAFFTVKSMSKLNPQGYWDVEPVNSSSSSSSSDKQQASIKQCALTGTDSRGYCDIDIQPPPPPPAAVSDTTTAAEAGNGGGASEEKDSCKLELTESSFFTVKSSTRPDSKGYCDVDLTSAPPLPPPLSTDPRGYCEVDIFSPPPPLPPPLKDAYLPDSATSSKESDTQNTASTTAAKASNFGYYEIDLYTPPSPGKTNEGPSPPAVPATRPKPKKRRIGSAEGCSSLSSGSPEPFSEKGKDRKPLSLSNQSSPSKKPFTGGGEVAANSKPPAPPRRRAPPPIPSPSFVEAPMMSPVRKAPMTSPERVFSSGLATLPRSPKYGKKAYREKSATLPLNTSQELEGFLSRKFQMLESSAHVQARDQEGVGAEGNKMDDSITASQQSPGLKKKFKGLFKLRGNSNPTPPTASESPSSSSSLGFIRRSFRKKKKPLQGAGGGGGGGGDVQSPKSPAKVAPVFSPQSEAGGGSVSYEADGEEEEEEEDETIGGIYSVVGAAAKTKPPAKADLLEMDSHGYDIVNKDPKKGQSSKGDRLRSASSMEHLYDVADDKRVGGAAGGGARSVDNSPQVPRRPVAAPPARPHPFLNPLAEDPAPKQVDLTGLYATVSKPSGGSTEEKMAPKTEEIGKQQQQQLQEEKEDEVRKESAMSEPHPDDGSRSHLKKDEEERRIVVTSLDQKYGKPEGVPSDGEEPFLPSSEIVHTVSGGDVYAVVHTKKPSKKKKPIASSFDSALLDSDQRPELKPLSASTLTTQSSEGSQVDSGFTTSLPLTVTAPSKPATLSKPSRSKPPPPKPVPYNKTSVSPLHPVVENLPPSASPTTVAVSSSGPQQRLDKSTSTTGLEARVARMSLPTDIITQPPSRPLPTPPSLATSVPGVSPLSPMVDKARAASLTSGPPSFPPPPPPPEDDDDQLTAQSEHTYESLGKTESKKAKKKKIVPFSRFESRDGDLEDNDVPDVDEGLYTSIGSGDNGSRTAQAKKTTPSKKTMSLPRNFLGGPAKTSPQLKRLPHVYTTLEEAANDEAADDSCPVLAEDDRRKTIAVPMRSHVYETVSEARLNRDSSTGGGGGPQRAKLMKAPKLKPKTVPPPAPPAGGGSRSPGDKEATANSLAPPKKLSLSKQSSSPPPLRRDSLDPALSPAPLLQRSGSLRITGTPTDPRIGKRIHVAMEMAGGVASDTEVCGVGATAGHHGDSEPKFLFSQNRSRNFISAGDSDTVVTAPSPHRFSTVTTATSISTAPTADEDSDGDILYSTDWETSSGEEDDEELGSPKPARSKTFYIAQEVLTTERTFVKGLTLLDKEFRQAVRSANNAHEKPVIADDILRLILGNVGSLRTLNSGMLQELEERMSTWETNPKIGDIILSRAPYFKLYTEYISRFDKALKTLEESVKKYPLFGEVVREFESQAKCAQIPLAGYMLDIVTRIPRYKLLLTDYVKHLPSDSKDKIPSERALEIISSVATHVNETIRQMDNFRKVVDVRKKLIGDSGDSLITPYRKLLKEGELLKSARKDKQPRMFFLFSDILIYASSIPPANTTYKVLRRIPLEGMRVAPLDDPEMRHGFQIISTCKSFRLEASTGEEKRQWLTAFELAIKEHNELAKTKEQARMSLVAEQGTDEAPIGHFAPPWLPDSAVSMCQLCSVTFTVTRRRHHCRACGMIFCAQCSHYSAPLKYKESKAGRVCQSCYEKITSYGVEEVDGDGRAPPPPPSQFKRGSLKRNVSMPAVLRELKARDRNAQMSGYMLTSTSKNRRWKKRWFVVYNLVIFVFERHEDVSAKKSVTLPSYQVISPIPGHDDPLVFCLKHPGAGKLYLKADSGEQLARWLDVLRKAVRGEIDEEVEGEEEGEGGGADDDTMATNKTGDPAAEVLKASPEPET